MAGIVPKFCQKHLKIHVCESISVKSQLKSQEDSIAAKVRRLHGIQTEEEIVESSKKQKVIKGSIQDILEKAKLRNQKTKEKIGLKKEEIGKEISEEEANDRMAALRQKLGQDAPSPTTSTAKKAKKTTSTKKAVVAKKVTSTKTVVAKKTTSTTKVTSTKKPTTVKKPVKKENIDLYEDAMNQPTEVVDSTVAPTFTLEQTKELIEDAVQQALIKAGLVKDEE